MAAAIRHRDTVLGMNIHAAEDYYSPIRIVEEFSEVTGKKAEFVSLSPDEYLKTVPAAVGQELLENHLLLNGPGYYAGVSLEESLELLDEKSPTTWKEFVARSDAWK